MLKTATDHVSVSGLTVSLDHISFEKVIEEAGVSRSSAYRIWQSRGDFVQELMCTLASPDWQEGLTVNNPAFAATMRHMLNCVDLLQTDQGRRFLAIEAARAGSRSEYSRRLNSAQWKTYVALTSTYMSLPDSPFRDRLKASLQATESRIQETLGNLYAASATFLGHRVRYPDITWSEVAAMCVRVMDGAVLRAICDPQLAERPFLAAPFGGKEQEWTPLTISYASTMFSFIEPDPDFTPLPKNELIATLEKLIKEAQPQIKLEA